MIALIFVMMMDFKVPTNYYFDPFKVKNILMAVNRKDKRSKYFSEKVKKWNYDSGALV
jgi:hypothetical protein